MARHLVRVEKNMLKERREIVDDIQSQLNEVELAVEAAFTAIGSLAISLPVARRRANISPVAGQAAFDSIGAAMAGIILVRSHMVDAHAHLEDTRAQFRMPVVGTGAGYEKPPRELVKGALEIVPASQAA
jgi:hypothetical protein